MHYPFLRPNDTSTGGAGGGGSGGHTAGYGRVMIQIPPQSRPFPWPLPYSATQGGTGSMPGGNTITTPMPPYNPAPSIWGPWQVFPQGWLSWFPLRS